MVTLKDFLDLDFTICGLDIELRCPKQLVETHTIGRGAWLAQYDKYCGAVNDHVDMYNTALNKPRFIHNVDLNFHQTDKPYRGACRPWGVELDVIPREFLKFPVSMMRPWSGGAFKNKHEHGTYYSLWLEVPEGYSYMTANHQTIEPEEPEEDNITFDDILEGNT